MCVLISLQLLIVLFLIVKRTERDMIKNPYWSSCVSTRYSRQIINETWIFSTYFRNSANAPKNAMFDGRHRTSWKQYKKRSRCHTPTYIHSNVFCCISFLPPVRSNEEIFMVTSNETVLNISQNGLYHIQWPISWKILYYDYSVRK